MAISSVYTLAINARGELIAEYSYDEWGKLLDITTAQENNTEQLAVAEINPLSYRGYYYDNETGMYYLQSRYYNPELCRFISADGFAYIKTDTPVSVNAYAYCINNPLKYFDPSGHYTTENWFDAALRGLLIAIEMDAVIDVIEQISNFFGSSFNEWYKTLVDNTTLKQLTEDLVSIITIAFNDVSSGGLFELFGEESIKQIVKRLIDSPKNIDELKEFYPDFTKSKMFPVIGALISFVGVMDSEYFTDFQKTILNILNVADAALDVFGLGLVSLLVGLSEKIMEYIFRFNNNEYL